jgi:hypothetical protein
MKNFKIITYISVDENVSEDELASIFSELIHYGLVDSSITVDDIVIEADS